MKDSINTDYLRKYHPVNMELFFFLVRLRQLQSLSQEQIIDAVKSACDFFGMPLPQIGNTTGHPKYSTMFYRGADKNSYDDDLICYDLQELAYLHISTFDALSLVLTHEATHRRTQMFNFPGPNKGAYAKECISDWYMGVRAGMNTMKDISLVAEGLGETNGSNTHPAGHIRKSFIQNGFQTGYLNRSEHGANFEYFLNDFKEYYMKELPNIEKEYPKYFNLLQRTIHKKTFDF